MSKTRKKSVIPRLIKECGKLAIPLAVSSFITLLSVALGLYAPDVTGNLTQRIYDTASGTLAPDFNDFISSAAILAVIYTSVAACEIICKVINCNTISRHFTRDIRVDISAKISRLSVGTIDSTPNGEILAHMMNDVSAMSGTIYSLFDLLISGIIKLVLIVALLFILDPSTAAVIVVIVPLSLALSGFLATRSEKHYYEVRKINGSICALAEEDFTCFDTVRAFDIAKKQNAEFRRRSENLRKAGEKGAFLSAVVTPVITFANALTYVFICALGGYFAVIGKFGVGKIVKIILYSQMLQGPLESLAGGFSSMQNTLAAARRVYDFLDSDEMAEDDGITLSDPKGDVSFENVNFAYTPDKPLIRDFSVDIKAGQKCAIVGPTGCGKTTLVNLLMRFYEADSGSIKIDGTDIRDMSKAGVRSLFQMVLQDVWLFSGSIRNNVAYGREDATDEEIEEACRRARIDGFIRSLPEGYDTVLNEETADISGGQKQLLTIARAFLADRKLLILDEATSGVDTRTEVQIQQSMKELTKGRTSFVIAHRLSTVTDADVILVMSDGRLVEKGTHEELLEKRGFYYDIFMSQFDG